MSAAVSKTRGAESTRYDERDARYETIGRWQGVWPAVALGGAGWPLAGPAGAAAAAAAQAARRRRSAHAAAHRPGGEVNLVLPDLNTGDFLAA